MALVVGRGAWGARASRGVELEGGAGRVAEPLVRVDLDAGGVRDGEELQALALELPAATAVKTPELTMVVTALFKDEE